MGKGKLKKFIQNTTYQHVIEPEVKEFISIDHPIKGKWNERIFKNNHPIVLELGCGKGEYTVGLSKLFSKKNFIGVDIKGARIWKGATQVENEKITNAAFLRTRIELITSFFVENEVDEIWITFPDPQMKKKRAKKRLSSSVFLSKYQQLLKNNGIVHLKTDSAFLYQYTLKVITLNDLEIVKKTNDLYAEKPIDKTLNIQTHYENLHIDEGENINYICFKLDKYKKLVEPETEQNEE